MTKRVAAKNNCPSCRGVGTTAAFLDDDEGGYIDTAMRCRRCGGTGRISSQQVDWITRGRRCMNLRRARSESLYDASQRLGISAASLSAMEHGHADPTALETAWA